MFQKIRPYLPSKKILLLLLGCIVVVGLILFISNFDRVKTIVAVKQAKKDLGTGSVTEFVGTDTDGDTIPDWEEPLWGTDPNNPDSDGNGVSDGDEIKEKRLAIQEKTGTTADVDLNETQAFAREFFGIVASLSAQGKLTDEALQNLSLEFVNKTLADTTLVAPYTQSDLTVTYKNTDDARKAYNAALEKTLDPYLDAEMGLELQVIASGIYLGDNTRIQNLAVPAATYKEIAEKLLTVTVPLEAASRHLALVNNFALMGISLEQTTHILADPIVGVAGLVMYKNSYDALLTSINDLGAYFESHGIL